MDGLLRSGFELVFRDSLNSTPRRHVNPPASTPSSPPPGRILYHSTSPSIPPGAVPSANTTNMTQGVAPPSSPAIMSSPMSISTPIKKPRSTSDMGITCHMQLEPRQTLNFLPTSPTSPNPAPLHTSDRPFDFRRLPELRSPCTLHSMQKTPRPACDPMYMHPAYTSSSMLLSPPLTPSSYSARPLDVLASVSAEQSVDINLTPVVASIAIASPSHAPSSALSSAPATASALSTATATATATAALASASASASAPAPALASALASSSSSAPASLLRKDDGGQKMYEKKCLTRTTSSPIRKKNAMVGVTGSAGSPRMERRLSAPAGGNAGCATPSLSSCTTTTTTTMTTLTSTRTTTLTNGVGFTGSVGYKNNGKLCRIFKCSQCPSTFSQQFNLNKHVRAVHERRRPFQCDVCFARFQQKSHRTMHHLAVHEKLRQFSCDQCSASFSWRGVLKKHRKSIHGIDE